MMLMFKFASNDGKLSIDIINVYNNTDYDIISIISYISVNISLQKHLQQQQQQQQQHRQQQQQ
jgi:hypothetical protein